MASIRSERWPRFVGEIIGNDSLRRCSSVVRSLVVQESVKNAGVKRRWLATNLSSLLDKVLGRAEAKAPCQDQLKLGDLLETRDQLEAAIAALAQSARRSNVVKCEYNDDFLSFVGAGTSDAYRTDAVPLFGVSGPAITSALRTGAPVSRPWTGGVSAGHSPDFLTGLYSGCPLYWQYVEYCQAQTEDNAAFESFLRAVLRYVVARIKVIFEFRKTFWRLFEYLMTQRAWHLQHGAHPPRVGTLLRSPISLLGAAA